MAEVQQQLRTHADYLLVLQRSLKNLSAVYTDELMRDINLRDFERDEDLVANLDKEIQWLARRPCGIHLRDMYNVGQFLFDVPADFNLLRTGGGSSKLEVHRRYIEPGVDAWRFIRPFDIRDVTPALDDAVEQCGGELVEAVVRGWVIKGAGPDVKPEVLNLWGQHIHTRRFAEVWDEASKYTPDRLANMVQLAKEPSRTCPLVMRIPTSYMYDRTQLDFIAKKAIEVLFETSYGMIEFHINGKTDETLEIDVSANKAFLSDYITEIRATLMKEKVESWKYDDPETYTTDPKVATHLQIFLQHHHKEALSSMLGRPIAIATPADAHVATPPPGAEQTNPEELLRTVESLKKIHDQRMARERDREKEEKEQEEQDEGNGQ